MFEELEKEPAHETLILKGMDAVLKYYTLKRFPEGEELPELATSLLIDQETSLPENVKVEQFIDDDKRSTVILVGNPKYAGNEPIKVTITWVEDADFLSLIESAGNNFRPSFHRTSMFFKNIKLTVPSEIADKLKAVFYDSFVIPQNDAIRISPEEAAQKVVGNLGDK